VYAVTSDRVLFQCDPIGREDRSLGWEYACRRAPCNSLVADEFSNRIEIEFEHEHLLLSRAVAFAFISLAGPGRWAVDQKSLLRARANHVKIHCRELEILFYE
jgi:hypothetical protein